MLGTESKAMASNARTGVSWGLIGVFTASIFLSATLLFSVQPMFAKLVLPLLGGSSSVWNTAMVFFQGMLLGGYIYAHIISKYLRLQMQVIVHAFVIAAGLFFLPLAIASGWTPPTEGAHAFWLLGLFAVSVGVPFFAISANAPLLQRWFSRTDDKDADDPYFLYAASNAGSLLSLCLYPVLFEPLLRLNEQTELWSQGYLLLLLVIILAGFAAVRRQKPGQPQVTASETSGQKVATSQRLFWIFLAFIPSSLMLGVTSHMANNIASAPFLWIIPLSLYLLTFVVAFSKKRLVTTQQLARLFPWVIAVAIFAGFVFKMVVIPSIVISLICYFLIALMCHMRLVDERPSAEYLTEFYIWMSLGGVLGGIFNALIAPVIFSDVYEYLIVLALSQLAVPAADGQKSDLGKIVLKALPFAVSGFIVFKLMTLMNIDVRAAALLGGGVFVYGLNKARGNMKLVLVDSAALVVLALFIPTYFKAPVLQDRSFFGILQVKAQDSEFGKVHLFRHGDTVHNYQFQDQALRKVPLAYYAKGNTFESALSAARARTPDMAIAMVGLGAGAMACYEQPGDSWTYYEIDPAVVSMATNPDYFSYISECAPNANIVTGDARMTILALPEKSQDMIMIDAFSSDAIPTHLVTREALAIYRSRLKDNGLIFFHTSNRVMDVSSVVARLAEDAGLDVRYTARSDFSGEPYKAYYSPSIAMVMGQAEDIDAVFGQDKNWMGFIPGKSVKTWSDDYSSVIGALRSHANKEFRVVPAR